MAEKSETKDKVKELMEDPEAQAKIKEQVNAMQKLVERQMAEEEDENMKYKKRMFFLIPYNVLMIALTLKYCQNYKYVAQKLWPNRKRATLGNLLYVGTIQAIGMSTLYFGGNMAILGVNPRAVYKRHLRQKEEELELLANTSLNLNGPVEEQITGAIKEVESFFSDDPSKTVQDVFLIQMFRSMGLSDQTILVIEQDLRNQHLRELKKQKGEQLEDKKERNENKEK